MSATRIPADLDTREVALDPRRSFLVQAPAGSGKTELLIQRVLRLLASVQQPEEILAITFTRKAAAEMRERILSALSRARRNERPAETHLERGFELARAVDARDRELGWGLAEQPGRLRIGTIDSINSWLNNRAPLSAGPQALNRVTENPAALYREAARQTVALAAEGDDHGAAVREFLNHCDNRADLAIRRLEEMLGRRDQWLRHTGVGAVADSVRQKLEESIGELVTDTLRQAETHLPQSVRQELCELLAFMGQNLAHRGEVSDLTEWRDRPAFPTANHELVRLWRGIAQGLLTKQDRAWRKRGGLNVRTGLPKGEYKSRMIALLEQLESNDELHTALRAVAGLPDAHYSDAQWQSLKAILRVLPLAAAVLQRVFHAHGETDFTQIAANALASLGSEDTVTEISLVLDYRLRHILLDEFQDTSRSQYELLCRLISGWETGDGRTVFLVGDPMQSIYRFREAEVGVFLQCRVTGLGHLPLEFLRLETNFRSAPAIVNWINRSFAEILPAAEDPKTGAVPLASSRAFRDDAEGTGVHWHLLDGDDRDTEAQRIAACVRDSLTRWPGDTVGILVRSRAHATAITRRLRVGGIAYSAPDLELLGQEPIIQDLLGLTRALLHPADRIAWLAVLRAPWCGLQLADLHALAAADPAACVGQLLRDDAVLANLSESGRARARRCRHALEPWLNRRGACALRELVEGAWQCLGGPACIGGADELEIADEYFAYLEEVDVGGDCPEVAELLDAIAERPVNRETGKDPRVQIMTMHKAKGLEFDAVLLPSLGVATRKSAKRLLLWHEHARANGNCSLVLAPIEARGNDKDPLFEWLWATERQREAYEQDRLLYVASTRARARLHLFASRPTGRDPETAQPLADSLLKSLWPVVPADIRAGRASEAGGPESKTGPSWYAPPLRRLPEAWKSPLTAGRPDWGTGEPPESTEQRVAQDTWTRHAGTVAHRWLQEIARAGVAGFDAQRVHGLQKIIRIQLRRLGSAPEEVDRACRRVCDALTGALDDPDGRWILSDEHQHVASEWSIRQFDAAGRVQELRIDRSFIDDEGRRWIVDFKIANPAPGETTEAFLAAQQRRYHSQLANYLDAVTDLEPARRPIQVALYFPLLPRLVPVGLAPVSE